MRRFIKKTQIAAVFLIAALTGMAGTLGSALAEETSIPVNSDGETLLSHTSDGETPLSPTSDEETSFSLTSDGDTSFSLPPDEETSFSLTPNGEAFIKMGYSAAQVFDCYGNQTGIFYDYIENFFTLALLRDTLRLVRGDEQVKVYSVSAGKIICESADSSLLTTEVVGDYVIMHSEDGTQVVLYDSWGVPVFFESDAVVSGCWWIGKTLYLVLDQNGEKRSLMWDPQSGAMQKADLPFLVEYTEKEIFSFGEYYLIYEENTDNTSNNQIRIVDRDGAVLLEGSGFLPEYASVFSEELARGYAGSGRYEQPFFVILLEGEGDVAIHHIYDTLLTERAAYSPDEWTQLYCPDGKYYVRPWDFAWDRYLIGVPFEELGGKICTGFIPCGNTYYPCAQEGNEFDVLIEGELLHLTLPEDETGILMMNRDFVQTESMRLYFTDTMERVSLEQIRTDEMTGLEGCMFNQNSIAYSFNYSEDDPSVGERYLILHREGDELLSAVRGPYRRFHAWYNGLWCAEADFNVSLLNSDGISVWTYWDDE